jgi:hypothetical protein
MGMGKTASFITALLLTALTALVFQNCSIPGEIDGKTKASLQGGSGDPYEGMPPVAMICTARTNAFGVQSLRLSPSGGGKYDVALTADGQEYVLRQSEALRFGVTVPVSWPAGTFGTVTSYFANPGSETTVNVTASGGSAVVFKFDCP